MCKSKLLYAQHSSCHHTVLLLYIITKPQLNSCISTAGQSETKLYGDKPRTKITFNSV